MAWTAPRTWVTGETVTAALMNAHIRDNFLETGAATVTTAGDIPYADAANSLGNRLGIGVEASSLVSTGSVPVWRAISGMNGDTDYTFDAGVGGGVANTWYDLDHGAWATGTSVTRTVTTGTSALVHLGARYVRHPTAGAQVDLSYRVSGATTVAVNIRWGTKSESSAASDFQSPGRSFYHTGLTAGSNTFTLQGMVTTADAAVIGFPYLIVEAK